MFGGFFHADDGSNYNLLAAGGGYDQYDTTRRIVFGPINLTARGDFEGSQAAVYLERGWNYSLGALSMRPMGALQYVYLHQDAFTETGAGPANLTVTDLDVNSLRSYLGARLSWETSTRRGWVVSPQLRAAWQHEFLDTFGVVNSAFGIATPPTFAVRGLDLGRDWAMLGAGIELSPRDNLTLSIDYHAQVNDRQAFHTGSARATKEW